jgi:hypothetical protein
MVFALDGSDHDRQVVVESPRNTYPRSRMFVAAGAAMGLAENAAFLARTQDGLGICIVTQNWVPCDPGPQPRRYMPS